MGSRKLKIVMLTFGFVVVGYLLACTMTTKIRSCDSVVDQGEQVTQTPYYEDFDLNVNLPLHIGVVVTNHSSCSKASLLVKSILMYCHSPIHFHFITDSDSMTILETLIDSWELLFVNTSFYTLEYLANVTDFGTRITSASVDALKLIFPLVLPPTVSQIVILNANIVVATDIEALWDMFEQIKGKIPIGMLQHLPQKEPDTRIGMLQHLPQKEPDTRILLMNVTAMRQANWYLRYQSTSAHQVISLHGVTIPSKWKTETQCLVNGEDCSDILGDESPSTNSLVNIVTVSGYYKLQRAVVMHMLTEPRTRMGDFVSNVCDWISPTCFEFRKKVTYRTHLYYTEYSYQSSDPYDVTMVTHLSFDRLHMFTRLLEYWDGPIGATIYMRDSDTLELLRFIHNSSIPRRKNVAIHIVYKKGDRYPINYLRNVAWNYSNTPYVFLNDADLMPSPNMYQLLKQSIKFSEDHHNVAFVIPAFETHVENLPFPGNKLVLEGLLSNRDVIPFKWDYHKQAHRPTNYKKWMGRIQSYSVHWSEYYEPYIVVHYEATRYDERFAGYGQNKVSQIEELHAQKYAFIVMPDVFVIHYPHPASKDESNFRGFSGRDMSPGNTHYYRCTQSIHEEFRKELREKYGLAKSSHSKIVVLVIVLLLFLLIFLGIVSLCIYVKIWGKSAS